MALWPFSFPITEKPIPRREDRRFYGESEKNFEHRLENAHLSGRISPDDLLTFGFTRDRKLVPVTYALP